MHDKQEGARGNALSEVIDRGIDGLLEADDALARIWRTILYEFNIKGGQMQGLLNAYQERTLKDLDATDRKKNSMKANLTRNLADTRMTWKTLIKGFQVLRFTKITLRLELTRAGNTREIVLDLVDE